MAEAKRSAKRLVDLVASGAGLAALAPVLGLATVAVWLSDRRSPFFVAERCGKEGVIFPMVKFRTMVKGAHLAGVSSTASTDPRITRIGRILRATKIDELPQLINVLRGEMSLVGPRPNVPLAVEGYSDRERDLLSIRPGITDLASIVFADEGAILAGRTDPDLAYEQLIRPGKSRLGLFYVEHASLSTDLRILALTCVNAVSRDRAISGVVSILRRHNAPRDLVNLAQRVEPLSPAPPPGMLGVVTSA